MPDPSPTAAATAAAAAAPAAAAARAAATAATAPAPTAAAAAAAAAAPPAPATAAVVVNYNAGELLSTCAKALGREGLGEIVVVDNASTDPSMRLLAARAPEVEQVLAGENLGFGAGANLGARSLRSDPDYLLICNPDLVPARGTVVTLVKVLEADPHLAIAGPMLREPSGTVYPSGRDFPGMGESIGHGFLGLFWGGNPWTRSYRRIGGEQHVSRAADWVSGAFFVVRRLAFEDVGGFDESYFMYCEDVDLCWRLRRAGWGVWYEPAAEVIHEQGRSTSRHPYRMLVAHHVSMMRFANRTATGWERALLPLVSAGLTARLVLAWAEHALSPRSRLRSRSGPGAKSG